MEAEATWGLRQLSLTLALWPVSWVGRRVRIPWHGFLLTPRGLGGKDGSPAGGACGVCRRDPSFLGPEAGRAGGAEGQGGPRASELPAAVNLPTPLPPFSGN